jgi:hypothetical protein
MGNSVPVRCPPTRHLALAHGPARTRTWIGQPDRGHQIARRQLGQHPGVDAVGLAGQRRQPLTICASAINTSQPCVSCTNRAPFIDSITAPDDQPGAQPGRASRRHPPAPRPPRLARRPRRPNRHPADVDSDPIRPGACSRASGACEHADPLGRVAGGRRAARGIAPVVHPPVFGCTGSSEVPVPIPCKTARPGCRV